MRERLYEIGLRKAIGAEDRDILLQFMTEAVFLSSIGAVVGLVIAVALCAAISPNFEAGLPVSGFAVVLAVAFAIGIGTVAGFIRHSRQLASPRSTPSAGSPFSRRKAYTRFSLGGAP